MFRGAPLLDGFEDNKHRMSNPHLAWLRNLALAVIHSGNGDRKLRASDLVDIADDAEIELPGSDPDDPRKSERDNVLRAMGRKLGRCFRNGDVIQFENLRITRTQRYAADRAVRTDVKEYVFTSLAPTGARDGPGGGGGAPPPDAAEGTDVRPYEGDPRPYRGHSAAMETPCAAIAAIESNRRNASKNSSEDLPPGHTENRDNAPQHETSYSGYGRNGRMAATTPPPGIFSDQAEVLKALTLKMREQNKRAEANQPEATVADAPAPAPAVNHQQERKQP